MRVLVTGGAGFIGSHFVRRLVARGDEVVVLDKLTYAGNPANLEGVDARLFVGDIADAEAVEAAGAGCEAVVNFAAETHVDRSILTPRDFVHTDVLGTLTLLEWARATGARYVQVSTDEVYGDLERGGRSREEDPLLPSSPYSASKAGGDLQVLAYVRTYGVNASITRGANTFGPRQYPEKLIPLFVTNALEGLPLPVYGDGLQRREWLHADDHCAAVEQVLEAGGPRRGLQHRRRRVREHRGHASDPRVDRGGRVTCPACRGPGRARPPLRPRRREATGARVGAGALLR